MPSSDNRLGALRRRLQHEGGQVLPLTALMMVVLIGFAALVVDVGRVYLAQRQLQNAVDSTAVAVAQNMPDDYAGWCQSAGSSASIDCASLTPAPPALGYGGATGARNALYGYGVAANNPTVTFICSPNGPNYKAGASPPATATCPADSSPQDAGALCNPGNMPNPPPNGCNAVTVSESATVKTTLAGIFGFSHFNLTASGTAIAPSQVAGPIDVAVVLDTTGSMVQGAPLASTVCPGAGQKPTKLDCVKAGVKALLQTLYPCNPGSCNGQPPLDKVELLAFPGLTSKAAVAAEQTCNALPNNAKAYDDPSKPAVNPFLTEGYTFTVVPWENTYSTWNGGSFVLNANDPLVKTLQIGGNCGLKAGGDTSYTSVIQAAQDSLTALGNDGATHAIVVLGDGEANYGPIYTSPTEPPTSIYRHTPCQTAVQEGQAATAAGTTIYTVGYWSPGTDQETQCVGMLGKNGNQGCPYKSTNQFGTNCAEPNLTGATYPSVCTGNWASSPIRGCWTMYNLASDPSQFYPDASDASLASIFKQIGQNLGQTRLINGP
jgi:Flp pilus assembly protein TadG